MSRVTETDLYAPVKTFLEARGYVVKAEIGAADVVACRDGEEPLIVELKTGFSLILLQQAVARQAVSDSVFVAVPRWKGKAGWKTFKGNIGLCKRLGVGVLSVRLDDASVQVHHEPAPFLPRKNKRRLAAVMSEFTRREGDPNTGGSTRVSLVTAYRQEAERCAVFLAGAGPSKGAVVARETGVGRATRMMADNHHGWFERVAVGIYGLTEAGQAVVAQRAD